MNLGFPIDRVQIDFCIELVATRLSDRFIARGLSRTFYLISMPTRFDIGSNFFSSVWSFFFLSFVQGARFLARVAFCLGVSDQSLW